MSPRAAFIKWSLIGAVTAGILLVAQVGAVGGPEGLLQVGETSALRPMIEEVLGTVPLSPGPGHDGQIYYAMAVDLDGDRVGPLLDHAGYRYRRVLFPLIASGFGVLEGVPLLWGMMVTVTISASVAAGSLAALAVDRGSSEWAALAALLNPGVWLSVRLLTADVLALALMIVALFVAGRSRTLMHGSFALSVLAKDVFVVTPLGLSVDRPKQDWSIAAVPVTVLALWTAFITLRLGGGFSPRGNVTLPLVGIVVASSNWSNLGPEEWFYLAFALGSVAFGLVVALRRRSRLRWPLFGWIGLAVMSSNWVWDFGNNAARAFAALPVLTVLALVTRGQDPSDSQPAASSSATNPAK